MLLLIPHSEVIAFPPLPSSFYGTVKLDGGNLPEGSVVQALISGQVYASSEVSLYQGDSVYSLVVPGDDTATTEVEGGKAGDTVQFKVSGVLANQTGIWQSGSNVNLELTADSGGEVPAATQTSAPTSTARSTSTGTVAVPSSTAYPTAVPPKATRQVVAANTQPAMSTAQEAAYPVLTTPGAMDQSYPADVETLPLAQEVTAEEALIEKNEALTQNTEPSGDVELSGIEESQASGERERNLTWLYFAIPAGILIVAGIVIGAVKRKKPTDQTLL